MRLSQFCVVSIHLNLTARLDLIAARRARLSYSHASIVSVGSC